MAAPLDPAFEPMIAAMPPLAITAESLPMVRSAFGLMGQDVPAPETDLIVTDHVVAVDGLEPGVPVRLYRPPSTDPLPVLYWMHGGGLVMGTHDMGESVAASWCARAGCAIASVDYRLAPEHPFPTPLEDCYAGLAWLQGEGSDLGLDVSRIAIGGGSAGSNLAAALALVARDRGEVSVMYQLLIYPMLDDRNISPADDQNPETLVWSRGSNDFGWNAYLEGRAGAAEIPIYAAPGRADVSSLVGLPPAFITVGDLDLFYEEDVAYASRLSEAGVPVELHVIPGAPHGYDALAPSAPIAQRNRALYLGALADAFNQ